MDKILHIINHYHEGFGYQENYLPAFQKKLGYDVVILTSDYYAQFPDYDTTMKLVLGDRRKGEGVEYDNGVKIIRRRSYFNNLRPGFIYFDIVETLLEFVPDVVHVHNATNFWLPEVMYYQKKLGYKVFVDVHQDFSVENYGGCCFGKMYYLIWRLYYLYLNKNNRVSAYLPITNQSSRWLKLRLGVSDERHIILPLGVDLESMRYDSSAEQQLRNEWNAWNKYVIVNAGKQYHEKKVVWIIELAKHLFNAGIDLYLVLVGTAGHEYDDEITQSLGGLPGDRWKRYPFTNREELSRIYSASDLGVWPGIPSNTIQEAMACCTALLLPDNDIVGHLIDGNGCYISDDMDKTVSDVFSILQSREKLQNMKERSAQLSQQYSWSYIAEKSIEIYRQ